MQKDKQMTHWLNRAKSFLPKVLPQSFVFPDLICTVYMKENGRSYCTVHTHTRITHLTYSPHTHTHTPTHTHTQAHTHTHTHTHTMTFSLSLWWLFFPFCLSL